MTMDNVKPAKRVTHSCGHVVTHGGNAADPTAVYAEAAGLMTNETSDEECFTCKHPEIWKDMQQKARGVQ